MPPHADAVELLLFYPVLSPSHSPHPSVAPDLVKFGFPDVALYLSDYAMYDNERHPMAKERPIPPGVKQDKLPYA